MARLRLERGEHACVFATRYLGKLMYPTGVSRYICIAQQQKLARLKQVCGIEATAHRVASPLYIFFQAER
jgi:hypothetical protein